MASLGFGSPTPQSKQTQPSEVYDPRTGSWRAQVGPQTAWQTYAPPGGQGGYGQQGGGQQGGQQGGYGQQGRYGPGYTDDIGQLGGYYGQQGGQGGYNYGGQPPPGQYYSQQYASGGQQQGGGQQGGYNPNYTYGQVDRSQLAQYPSNWNPDTQPGVSYINGKWQEVKGGADVTWDSGTNTYYWHGQPLTDSEYQRLAQGGPQAMNTGYANTNYGLDDTNQNLRVLGFGQPGEQVNVNDFMHNVWGGGSSTAGLGGGQMPQAGHVGAPPSINAPVAQAGQAGFKDFDALQQAMYHQQFDPTQTELTRQQGLADDRMAAQLAQAGISESGTGVAQRAFQSGEYDRQMVQASKEAATNATVQRYGMEYQQSLDNAKMQQETNLANANMNLQAQTANAQNILTANISNAQLATQASIAGAQIGSQERIAGANIASQEKIAMGQQYLAAVGLNFQQGHQARQDYLQLMGLQEQDLQRMDTSQLNWTSLLFNTYIQQVGAIINAGGGSFGKTDASSSSQGGDLRLPGGIGGA